MNRLPQKLQDKEEHPMVRHEAAEALGAIGDEPSLKILKEYAEVRTSHCCLTGHVRSL